MKLKNFETSQLIVLSFALVIFVGASLLMLPVSNQGGTATAFIDALFSATSAVCVTGLSVVTVAVQYTLFGQIVMLVLIQIGGLGLMTLMAVLMLYLKQKFSLSQRVVLQEAVSTSKQSELNKMIRRIVKYTFIIELIGAIIISTTFIPRFGISTGIYYSIFHSVSAFCNAGFDVLGSNSLINYNQDYVLMLTIAGLIITGGIGFPVWVDLISKSKMLIKRKSTFKNAVRKLEVHSKIVLIMTAVLLIGGMLLIFIFERNNPDSIGDMPLMQQLSSSFFQSTTTRTAGFSGLHQIKLTEASLFVSNTLMFIGGSPAGTAGGVKVTTMAIMLLAVVSEIKGERSVVVFLKTIATQLIYRATTILVLGITLVFASIVLLSIFEARSLHSHDLMTIMYEVTSAFATVGLSLDYTPYLSYLGKILIMILMFAGRLGPMTLSTALVKRQAESKASKVEYSKAKIIL